MDRVGLKKINKYGDCIKVVGYKDCHHCDIEFDNGYVLHDVDYRQFERGTAKSPFSKVVYNIGYMGIGKYKAVDPNGKAYKQYQSWKNMLRRCYDKKFHENNKTYVGCSVCEEWLNFQNYAKWYDENYYIIKGHKMELDKDILVKHNKIYSPDTCIFVPQKINGLFIKNERIRGDMKIGAMYKKTNGYKYIASQCSINNKIKSTLCNTEEEAFQLYKFNKEKEIKRIAEEFKNFIPEKLYNAMINYIVEDDD